MFFAKVIFRTDCNAVYLKENFIEELCTLFLELGKPQLKNCHGKVIPYDCYLWQNFCKNPLEMGYVIPLTGKSN